MQPQRINVIRASAPLGRETLFLTCSFPVQVLFIILANQVQNVNPHFKNEGKNPIFLQCSQIVHVLTVRFVEKYRFMKIARFIPTQR